MVDSFRIDKLPGLGCLHAGSWSVATFILQRHFRMREWMRSMKIELYFVVGYRKLGHQIIVEALNLSSRDTLVRCVPVRRRVGREPPFVRYSMSVGIVLISPRCALLQHGSLGPLGANVSQANT